MRKYPVEVWYLFFTEKMLQNIVSYSYILSKNYYKTYRTDRETGIIEIKALLELFYSTLLSYTPRKNKNVFLMTTILENYTKDEGTGKPELIIKYNKTKGGVDTVHKLCESYNCTYHPSLVPRNFL